MVSASPHDLIRLLLQRSDLHPVGALDGRDLAGIDRSIVDRLLRAGILVERARLEAADDLEVQMIDGTPIGFSADGRELGAEIDPEMLRQLEIDVLALCRALRRANGLSGPHVERLSPFLYFLGEQRASARRRSVFLARLLHDGNAFEVIAAVRARASGRPLVILTPTAPALRLETARRIAADGVALADISESLDASAPDHLTITFPSAATAQAGNDATVRLLIDTTGHIVRLDGVEVTLAVREFNLLVALANEAATEGGIVDHDTLYAAIDGAGTGSGLGANDEQIAKSVSLLRAALSDAAGIVGAERSALVRNKRKVGYRLGLPASEVRVL